MRHDFKTITSLQTPRGSRKYWIRHVAATCAERCLPFRQKIKICLPARMAYDVFDIFKKQSLDSVFENFP